ncbi:unnamed protein product, partial [Thlaspi arvense]
MENKYWSIVMMVFVLMVMLAIGKKESLLCVFKCEIHCKLQVASHCFTRCVNERCRHLQPPTRTFHSISRSQEMDNKSKMVMMIFVLVVMTVIEGEANNDEICSLQCSMNCLDPELKTP